MKEEVFTDIGKYLRGELNSKETEAFENKMQTDNELAMHVNLEKEIMNAISDEGISNLEFNLQSIREEDVKRKIKYRKTSLFNKKPFLIAASITFILISISTLYFFFQPEPSNQDLFANYYTTYNLENLRAGNSQYQEALEKYQNQNYSDALILLKNESEVNPSKIRIQLLMAQCYLNLNDLKNAIHYFEKVNAHQNNIYIPDANWYLALAYLKNNEQQSAIDLLRKIIEHKAKYYEKAAQLLNDLTP